MRDLWGLLKPVLLVLAIMALFLVVLPLVSKAMKASVPSPQVRGVLVQPSEGPDLDVMCGIPSEEEGP